MSSPDRDPKSASFAESAARPGPNLLSELWGLLKANKKWWLVPVLVVLLLLGVFTVLAATGAAPFIYTLF